MRNLEPTTTEEIPKPVVQKQNVPFSLPMSIITSQSPAPLLPSLSKAIKCGTARREAVTACGELEPKWGEEGNPKEDRLRWGVKGRGMRRASVWGCSLKRFAGA